MNKPIGGFFELELPTGGTPYHKDALALATGRSCIGWVLDAEKPTRVIVPNYSCYAVFEPIIERGIELTTYEINDQLDPVDDIRPKAGDLLIFVNFFGLKNQQAEKFSSKYGKQVLVDDTHRYFHKGYQHSYSFTSARKYFGVPDGAFLYGPEVSDLNKVIKRNTNVSLDHSALRLCGQQEKAFQYFQRHESSLNSEVLGMSLVSEYLLRLIDMESVKSKRESNFHYLEKSLNELNSLEIDVSSLDTPFCYPFLPSKTVDKSKLYSEQIFVPTYWPDALSRKNASEKTIDLTTRMLPLPIDHRYGQDEMDRMLNVLINALEI